MTSPLWNEFGFALKFPFAVRYIVYRVQYVHMLILALSATLESPTFKKSNFRNDVTLRNDTHIRIHYVMIRICYGLSCLNWNCHLNEQSSRCVSNVPLICGPIFFRSKNKVGPQNGNNFQSAVHFIFHWKLKNR